MIGQAEGKLGLDSEFFLLAKKGEKELEDTFVCIHLKGLVVFQDQLKYQKEPLLCMNGMDFNLK